MKKYSKTQYGIVINILFIILIPFLIYSSYYQTGPKPVPTIVTIIISLLFLVIILMFYKLKIIIKDEKIEVKFGIGVFSKSVKLEDIDLSTLKKIKMPWYYGVGIRLTTKGWLWNVKFGDAIYFKTKNNKTFLVGTDDYETIIKVLNNNLSSSISTSLNIN